MNLTSAPIVPVPPFLSSNASTNQFGDGSPFGLSSGAGAPATYGVEQLVWCSSSTPLMKILIFEPRSPLPLNAESIVYPFWLARTVSPDTRSTLL